MWGRESGAARRQGADAYDTEFARHIAPRSFHIADRATYLEFEVGPGGQAGQREATSSKVEKRIKSLSPPSASAHNMLYSSHIMSPAYYKAQLAFPSPPPLRVLQTALQRTARALWHAIPTTLIVNARLLGLAAEAQDVVVRARVAPMGPISGSRSSMS